MVLVLTCLLFVFVRVLALTELGKIKEYRPHVRLHKARKRARIESCQGKSTLPAFLFENNQLTGRK